MKHVHKALRLRHHKHTGKILHRKHTSYGVLFALMIVPAVLLAFAGRIAIAGDYMVSATVPALPPDSSPTITTPVDNATIRDGDVTVQGDCPVAIPAVIIVIYDGDRVLGSVSCSAAGTFSVPVTLTYGAHVLVAKVITITGNQGKSSSPVRVARIQSSASSSQQSQGISGHATSQIQGGGIDLASILHIDPKDIYVVLDEANATTWSGVVSGGVPPYILSIEWGDGLTDRYDVTDSAEQTFAHQYASGGTYPIFIRAQDTSGNVAMLRSTAVAFTVQYKSILDGRYEQLPPFVTFLQRYAVQIYTVSLFGLIFLWYIEHGSRMTWHLLGHGPFGVPKKVQTHSRRKRR